MLVAGFFVVSGAKPASALSIAPAVFEVQGLSGETKTFSIQVTNDEDRPVQIVPEIQKFLPLGTTGQQQFLPPTDLSGLPTWTYIDGANSWLQPLERRNVTVQVRIPTDAPSGGQYEAIFFSTQGADATNGASGFRSRVGALVLLTVGDVNAARLQVTDWRLSGSGTREALDETIQVTLRNTGTTHIAPTGTLMIRNIFGTAVKQVALNPTGGRILPTSERSFSISLGVQNEQNEATKSIWSGISHEFSAFGFGPYTVSLEGVDRLEHQPAPLRFFVMPWKLLALLLGVLVVITSSFYGYRAYLIRRWHGRAD